MKKMSRRKKIIIGIVVFIIMSQILRPLTQPITDGLGSIYDQQSTVVSITQTARAEATATKEPQGPVIIIIVP